MTVDVNLENDKDAKMDDNKNGGISSKMNEINQQSKAFNFKSGGLPNSNN